MEKRRNPVFMSQDPSIFRGQRGKDKATKRTEKDWPDQEKIEKSGVLEFRCFKKGNVITHIKCY